MSTGPQLANKRAKWAMAGLMRTAPDSRDARRDPVGYWDARTSANDWRASLSIACGARPDEIHPVLGTSPAASRNRLTSPVQLSFDLREAS